MDKIYFIIILWVLWVIVLSYIRGFFYDTWERDFFIPLLISLGTIIYLIISINIIVVEKSLGATLIGMISAVIVHEFRYKAYDWHGYLAILPLLFFFLLVPVYSVLGIYIILKLEHIL